MAIETLRGLSLSRPWPFAFINGPMELRKRIENRTWHPPDWILGRRIALHAAKSWDGSNGFIEGILGIRVPLKKEMAHSEIFAVATVIGYWKQCDASDLPDSLYVEPGIENIVRTVDGERFSPDEQAKWFIGPVAWILKDVIALPNPVSCSGALGLWKVPPQVKSSIESQLE